VDEENVNQGCGDYFNFEGIFDKLLEYFSV
jgi:hypothetical protein